MKVAILGAGPSGLIAAHAAVRAGVDFRDVNILSRPRTNGGPFQRVGKSDLFGAQWLQGPINGADNGGESKVVVKFLGDVVGYREKVYGPDYKGRPFDSHFFDPHSAWDIRRVYNFLWHKFESAMFNVVIDKRNSAKIIDNMAFSYDMIISTLPKKLFCRNPEHEFKSQTVYAIGDAPERGITCPIPCEPNTVVYNGSPEGSWYRVSNVFGHTTAEWSTANGARKPPLSGLAEVEKPLSTNCRCAPSMHHVGRYGKWDKHVLAHHVFDDIFRLCDNATRIGVQKELF